MRDLSEVFRSQKATALKWRLSTASERKDRLRRLLKVLLEREDDILAATEKDFGKPKTETLLTEMLLVAHEIHFALKNLDEWMRPRRVPSGLLLLGSSSEIAFDPRGACLIISPWNYPWQLALSPLVAALAAGNPVTLKPSELTPHCSELLHDLIESVFPPEEVHVATGGKEVAEELLAMPFDHIFFTGSTAVGKVVMAAASKTLASVTLELGGKSPAIVHASADLDWAAERLVWGKWVNAGQTCVAPDLLFVDRKTWPELRERMRRHGKRVSANPEKDLSSIVSDRHWVRMRKMSEEAAASRGWNLVFEIGSANESARRWPLQFFEMRDPAIASRTGLAREEIFGPLAPILLFDSLDEVIDRLGRDDKPLALYLFARDRAVQDRIVRATTSGGVVINDVLSHLANPHLPFGGVGGSGMGHYHGEHGFRAFSHEKAVLRQSASKILARFFEPPYSELKEKVLRRLIRLGI